MIALYYDLASPYGYLAVARAPQVLGREPLLVPILLGAIFQKRGYGSWADTPTRGENTREIERRAERYGLPPITWPPGWPANSLQAMRAATWATQQGKGAQFARAAYHRSFAHGQDIADPATLEAAAHDADLPGDELAAAVQDPAIKLALRATTEHAWEAGVRGVPTLRLDDSVFFGDDQLDEAAAHATFP